LIRAFECRDDYSYACKHEASLLCNAYSMREIFAEAGLTLQNGKFQFPPEIEHVKIDIGLSVNAPQSQIWIGADPLLFVLGFEPLKTNLDQIRSGSSNWNVKLSPHYIGTRVALLQTALYSKHMASGMTMYVTEADPGCSSLLEPKSFQVDHSEQVRVWTLNDFLVHFPFDRFPIIDHVKIDAQGADFEILKGAANYLDKIFAITLELDTSEYQDSTNSQELVEEFMHNHSFTRVKPGILTHLMFLLKGYKIDVETDDPTYINLDKINFSKGRRFLLFQRG